MCSGSFHVIKLDMTQGMYSTHNVILANELRLRFLAVIESWEMALFIIDNSHDVCLDDDIKTAEDKFAESLHLAQMGMYNLLENDVSNNYALRSFSQSISFHISRWKDAVRKLYP